MKLRPAIIDSFLLFHTLIPTDACSSTKAPASSWNACSDQAVFIRRGERFRNFKVGGAFCRTAIRARVRSLQPYKAVFRWCCAMPSQRNRRCGRRCRRLGYRDLGRHPTLHRPVSWHLEQHGEISAGIGGLWHISAPLESGLSEVNALKRAKVRRPERLFHRRVIRRGS